MTATQDLIKIWNQVPPDYYQSEISKNLLKRFWHTEKLKTFQKLIGRKKFNKVLDVGCASGYMANEISKVIPEASITAIDPYKKAIIYGKKTYPRIRFQLADAHKLPFKNNSFDLVVCYEVIEHLVDPQRALSEIKRVLAKDGRAVVAMDSGNWLFRIVWWLAEKTISRVWIGAHLHPYQHRELQAIIREVGFKIIKKHFSHFGMEVSFLLKK